MQVCNATTDNVYARQGRAAPARVHVEIYGSMAGAGRAVYILLRTTRCFVLEQVNSGRLFRSRFDFEFRKDWELRFRVHSAPTVYR